MWTNSRNLGEEILGWGTLLAGDAPEETEAAIKHALKNIPDAMAFSVTLDQGLVSTSCSKLKKDSALSEIQLEHLGKGKRSTSVAHLITPQTIFALGLSGASISMIEPMLKESYGEEVIAEVWKDPSLKPVLEILGNLQGLTNDFLVDEISLAAGIPAGIPTLDSSVLISHEKGDSTDLLKALNKTLNSLQSQSFTSSFNEGQLKINATALPGVGLVGKVLKDGKILMASSDIAWPVVAKQLEGEPSYFSNDLKVAGVSAGEFGKKHQVLQYFSTKPIVTMAQGFAGMAAGQLQGQGLSPEDFRQFVSHFDFRSASVTQADVRGDHLICQRDLMSLVE